MSDVSISGIGFALVILGVILAFVAMIFVATKGASGRTRGAGVLLIGPFPIVFGTDRESAKILMILAIVLIAIVLVFMLLPAFLLGR